MQTLGLDLQSLPDYTTDSVYGIARDVPLNYVPRSEVDNKLVENLTREKHLVVYGSSKQGKTCLRKHCLQESDYITVQCSNKWSVDDVNANVLKRAGFKTSVSEKRTLSGKQKIIASADLAVHGLGVKAGKELETGQDLETETKNLELDPSDANDIIAALNSISFRKYIVLEDFHYLPVETQRDFAVLLKAFHEASKLCFIVIGVWLEEDRLVVYNGDLTGRVVSINADKWVESELMEVVNAGAKLLNINFDAHFCSTLLSECYGSVSIVQEVCRRACVENGVTHTQKTRTEVGNGLDVRTLVGYVVAEQSARYMSFLTQFADGFQSTQLAMSKWLLYPLLTASTEKLEKGFKLKELRMAITSKHPSGEGLNSGNLTIALQSVASLQVKKKITPIILDYDETGRELSVVDRGFIIWLRNQDLSGLRESLDLPALESGPVLAQPGIDAR